MRTYRRWPAVMAGVMLVGMGACDDDDDKPVVDAGGDAANGGSGGGGAGGTGGTPGAGGAGGGPATDGPATDGNTDAVAANLFQRLGGEMGIRAVITDFVVNRVLKDPKINGYFLNSTVSGSKVIDCLVLQVGTLAGGPTPQFTYPSNGCRNMKDSHLGLRISMQDFNDLAGHLVAALQAKTVAQADIDAIVAAVSPMATDIVEDQANNKTVYQRVGRKPAIQTVIDMFVGKVVADARINGFFGAANASRLKACLVRQVCSIDGPCKYGKEVDGEADGLTAANPCRDMKSSHTSLTSPPNGAAGSRGINKVDFDALVEDLVMVLDGANVAAADKMAILSALAPTCDDIVAGGTGCPGRTVIALTSANTLVTFDSKTPGTVSTPVAITGLGAGETLVGITIRPSNGQLFGLGSSSRIYEINRATGTATAKGAGPFTPALAGTSFGFDFNPTVDRIRVVSDTEQNLRLHPDMGTVVDFDATAAGVQGDTNLTPAGEVVAASYTGSVAGATKTTLYVIDAASDTFARQGGVDGMPSPNLGVLTTVGPLGVDITGASGFDIAPNTNVAYGAFQVAGATNLYTVNMTSGAATLVAPIGGGVAVKAIAVVPY
jgi:truncated hemoglobin YjbI